MHRKSNWMNPDMHTVFLDTKLLNATLLNMYNPVLMETILKKFLEQFIKDDRGDHWLSSRNFA